MDPFDSLHPDDVRWDRIRDAYLGGEPAWRLCQTYDLALSTFRAKAKREGWRHCDQPPPPPPSPVEPEDAPFDPDLLVIQARRHLRRAVEAGDALNALRWMKMVDQLTDFAGRERRIRVRHDPDDRQAEADAREAAHRRREAAEAGAPMLAAPAPAADPSPSPDRAPVPESSLDSLFASDEPIDPQEDFGTFYDQLDSLDSFFTDRELAAHPELADAVRAMSALSPLLRDQARKRAEGP